MIDKDKIAEFLDAGNMQDRIDRFLEGALANNTSAVNEVEKKGYSFAEVVSEDEVYELKRNVDYDPSDPNSPPYLRGRRICGYLRTKDGRKIRCLMPAGFKTNHVGWGICKIHENRKVSANSQHTHFRILEGYRASGLALELKELGEIYPELLLDPKLGDIREEIFILEQLLRVELNNIHINPSEIRKTTKLLGEMKVARQKILTERLLLDLNSVKLFVISLMDVLRRNLGSAQYGKIANELQNLAFPLNKPMQEILSAQSASFLQSPAIQTVKSIVEEKSKMKDKKKRKIVEDDTN